MSLLVWLPLNGDLRNQGLSKVNASNNNAVISDSGKIGKCYSFDGTQYIDTGYYENFGTGDFTLCAWIYLTQVSGKTYQAILSNKTTSGASVGCAMYWNQTQKKFLWSTADGSSSTEIWSANTFDTIIYNSWHHIIMVRNNNDAKKGYFYLDGVRQELASVPAIRNVTNSTYTFKIGTLNPYNTTYSFTGKINDIRVYDHALSDLEVKQLSQGLVVHYQLKDPHISKTLVVNGFGELGTENWSNTTYISTTEIPSSLDSTIKASTYNGNNTIQNILVNNNTTYTISAYLKSSGATSGSTYPSIYPYDADGKFIATYNCAEGFSYSYKTTLARALKKGDTVVYATDLSPWTTGDNHYYHVAIFGYKDSFGRIYPDMGYTADSPKFGTKTDKSNINKTNNTITLLSAFTGEDRPAGTTICQATEGSTYVYPFGGINLSTLSNWTFKSATLSGSYPRLKYAKYMKWSDYSNIYVAGLTIKDNRWNTNVVYDSSGYANHGEAGSNLTVSTNAPRYGLSTVFDGETGNGYIETDYSTFPAVLNGDFTISMWLYREDSDRSILFGNWNLAANMFYFNLELINSYVRLYWNGDPSISFSNSIVSLNAWTLVTITRSGNTTKSYINGVLKDTSTTTLNGSLTNNTTKFRIARDSRSDSTMYKGRISDFRIYATALSADDVKDIYQSAGHVDNNGNFYAYEYVEG